MNSFPMEPFIKYLLPSILIFWMMGCPLQQDTEMETKVYGRENIENDSLHVALNLEEYDDWDSLYNRVNNIVCTDSTPYLSFTADGIKKSVYIYNRCSTVMLCPTSRNTLMIVNDTIHRMDPKSLLDSLGSEMKKHYTNQGESRYYSEKPEHFMVSIAYSGRGVDKLPNLLNRITNIYDDVNPRTELAIVLDQPPPPPPKNNNQERND